MNSIMKIGVVADVTGYVTGLDKASRATRAFAKGFDAVKGTIVSAHQAAHTSLLKMGAGLVGVGTSLVGATLAASGYETQLRNVQSITKDSWNTTLGYGKSLLDFSRTSTTSANDLVKSLYDVASSGFVGADALNIVKASSKAGAAGMSDASTAGFALVGALNAYGLSAKDVTGVSDVMFQTVNLGVLTFQDLADGMGQWIAIAATAKVPLKDAAAALATITRAGIRPDEASTSLARIIQSFLNPTKSMSEAVKQLGFDSGESMLKQIGLKASVEQIGRAAGGSASKVVDFFGDIRAGKGAMALLANEGKTYNVVAKGFNDQTQINGATAKAFAIQARGMGAQLTMLKNNITANLISFGQYLTPVARFGLVLANQVIKPIGLIAAPLRGVVAALAVVGTAMGLLGVGFLLTKLKVLTFSYALSKMGLGLSASHLAISAIGKGLLAMGNLTKNVRLSALGTDLGLAASKGNKFSFVMGLMTAAANFLGVSLSTVAIGLGLFTVAVAAGIGGYLAYKNAIHKASVEADAFVAKVMQYQDLKTPHGITAGIAEIRAQLKLAKQDYNTFGTGIGRSAERFVENVGPDPNNVQNAEAKVKALWAEEKKLVQMQDNLASSSGNVNAEISRLLFVNGQSSRSIHLTRDETNALAKSLGVDLAQGGKKGAENIDAVAQAAINAADSGVAFGQSYGAAALQVVALSKDAAKSANSFAQSVQDAFTSTYDITGKFTGSIIQDFNKFKMEGKKGAKVKVYTEGTFKVSDVMDFYRAAFQQDKVFEQDLQTAIRQGLNPSLISEFMKQGPEQAGKLLHTIVQPNQSALRQMANDYSKTLDQMAQQAAEFGRITAIAMTAPTDKVAKDLPGALQVDDTIMAMNARHMKVTIESVAKNAKLPVKTVERIGTEFGITMAHAITSFATAPIARSLQGALTLDHLNITKPKNAIDQAVKNLISGVSLKTNLIPGTPIAEKLWQSLTKKQANQFYDFQVHVMGEDKNGDPYFGLTDKAAVAKLLGRTGVTDPKLLMEIIPVFQASKQLQDMLTLDKVPPKQAAIIVSTVVNNKDPNQAMASLAFLAGTGKISTGTLKLGLQIIGTPEANATLTQIKQQQGRGKTDNKVTFSFDGKQVLVGLDAIKKKEDLVRSPTVQVHVRESTPKGTSSGNEGVRTGTTQTLDRASALYKEIQKEAQKDHTIKVHPDGSVDISQARLNAIQKKLDGLKSKKNSIYLPLDKKTIATKTTIYDLRSALQDITKGPWNVKVSVTGANLLPPKGAAYGGVFHMADGGFMQRPADAHVANNQTIMYGEDGTGGEAYIPLAASRRGRSKLLVKQVARMFGMKAMADGGIIGDVAWQQAHIADLMKMLRGTTAGKAAVAGAGKDAASQQQALQDLAKTYFQVEVAAGTSAAKQLAASKLSGDAWNDAAQRIQDAATAAKTRWDSIWQDLWTKGRVTTAAYFNYLKAEMAKLPAYSQDWLTLRDQIISIQTAMQDNQHAVGGMSDAAYMSILNKRLAATQKYSDAWKTIWDQIQSAQQEAQAKIAAAQDDAYNQNTLGTAAYLKDLQTRLAATKKWSSDYTSVLGQIESLQQSFKDPILNATNAVQQFSSQAPQGFGEVSAYFTHAIDAAKRFNADLSQLQKMGLDTQFLKQMAMAGPSSVPLMDAILQGGAKAVLQANQAQTTLRSLAGQTLGAFLGTGKVSGTAGSSLSGSYSSTFNLRMGNITVTGSGTTIAEVKQVVTEAMQQLAQEIGRNN